ncbi:hypothetical protein C8R43DRAFT_959358 [Mycena crocata]|nr:hypothetical protein C8R43DRAFT_959356 [Mycena crocata]KAJ7121995.1 hypothetical protein C8R43DRAFT_959358 [Mycena crocata]
MPFFQKKTARGQRTTSIAINLAARESATLNMSCIRIPRAGRQIQPEAYMIFIWIRRVLCAPIDASNRYTVTPTALTRHIEISRVTSKDPNWFLSFFFRQKPLAGKSNPMKYPPRTMSVHILPTEHPEHPLASGPGVLSPGISRIFHVSNGDLANYII